MGSHNLPVRVKYGVFFMSQKSELTSTIFHAVLHAVSCYIEHIIKVLYCVCEGSEPRVLTVCKITNRPRRPINCLGNLKFLLCGPLGNLMTPTPQALLPGRCSRITGQVVQQAVEVVRLGPLNRTAGCPCKQSFLTLAKMLVKTLLKF